MMCKHDNKSLGCAECASGNQQDTSDVPVRLTPVNSSDYVAGVGKEKMMEAFEKQIRFHQKQCMHFRKHGHDKEQEGFHAGAVMAFSKGQESARLHLEIGARQERVRIASQVRKWGKVELAENYDPESNIRSRCLYRYADRIESESP